MKITTDNCNKYTYRVRNEKELEKLIKFLYDKDQITYKMTNTYFDKYRFYLYKHREIYFIIKKLDQPHWSDGRILELYLSDIIHENTLDIKDTSINNITLVYVINIIKGLCIIVLIIIGMFFFKNASPDEIAGMCIGCLFFGALTANM